MKSRELLRQSLKELRRIRLILDDAAHCCKTKQKQVLFQSASTKLSSATGLIKTGLRK